MVADIFTALTEIVLAVIGVFTDIFSDTGIIAVFYDSVTGLTFIGVLLLIGFGFGLVRWAFSYVKKLLQLRRG